MPFRLLFFEEKIILCKFLNATLLSKFFLLALKSYMKKYITIMYRTRNSILNFIKVMVSNLMLRVIIVY